MLIKRRWSYFRRSSISSTTFLESWIASAVTSAALMVKFRSEAWPPPSKSSSFQTRRRKILCSSLATKRSSVSSSFSPNLANHSTFWIRTECLSTRLAFKFGSVSRLPRLRYQHFPLSYVWSSVALQRWTISKMTMKKIDLMQRSQRRLFRHLAQVRIRKVRRRETKSTDFSAGKTFRTTFSKK